MKDIEEAKVGSGTAVADKSAEKRAQLSLKMVQLRMKQNKEREALAAQKKSLQKEETMTESFSASQIAALKAEYSKINTIDPSSDTYKKLIAMLDKLDLKSLQSLAGAEVKFVSKLAQNRVARKNMKEEIQLSELSTNKLADYKKKAGADASAADKAGDMKRGNKRFSGIIKATRKQFDNDAKKTNEDLDIELAEVLAKDATAGDYIHDFVHSDNPKFAGKSKEMRKKMALAAYYAKQKNEELSPKQKALDKNKNGKIDGSDLAKLRGEELSAKQKVLDKNKNGKIDGSDLAAIRNKKKPQGADFAAQRRKERLASNGRMDEGKSDYEIYHKDYSSAVQAAIKQAEKRGFEVDMDDWHDKVATGPKKPSAGKTNSFSVKLKKDGKESKKALHLQVYNMDNHKYELNMYIESVEEASSPAQQAAIAIAMKKAGKKPKNMKEGVLDKIKSIKRGLEAKAKADDHWDKAMDTKSPDASKNLKKAVRYSNLLNKEQTGEKINAVTKHVTKGELTKSGVAKWLAEPMKKEEKIPEFKSGGSELAKKFNKAFKANGVDAKVKIRTVGNVSANEEVVTEAKKKTWKDMRKKVKNEEEVPNKATIKKGDDLSGKREPIEINPELKDTAK